MFLASSDIFLLYNGAGLSDAAEQLGQSALRIINIVMMPIGEWDMKQPGITALAHPLDTEVATRHGVFVFDDIKEIRRKYREGNDDCCSV